MSSRPLNVLVVTEDRRVLRHLSKALGAFGYCVQQAADQALAASILEGGRPDVLIVDSQPNFQATLQFCGSSLGHIPPGEVHTLLLLGDPTPQDVTDALEAGVDDFLAKPIVHGELLARLRAAARVLEFERRMRRQAGIDSVTGLPNRTSFLAKFQSELAGNPTQYTPAACVLVDLDLLGRINHTHGHPAGDATLRAVAEKLGSLCRREDLLCSFGAGRFCALLRETSEAATDGWVQRVREALAEIEVGLGDTAMHLTASFGITAVNGNAETAETPQDVVDRASRALQTAKSSGRDCAARFGQLDDDAEAWADFAAPGKLFERTTARDVMMPCSLVLRGDETVAEAAELFRQTRLDAMPVVDAGGKLTGLVFQESVVGGPVDTRCAPTQNGNLRVGNVLTTDMPVYDEDTSFATLRDFFTRDSRSTIVIVSDDRPTGLVTPNSLAALSTPLSTESFTPAGPYRDDSTYLQVSDLCPLDQT